ncbi:MAG: SRPBCC family protein [SAR86 cluster bacterium]|nr:SRPBCC family protein [SAR86 cluster bacterium]
MAETKVIQHINASLDLVWSKLGDFAGLKPGSGIESVEYEGEGVGMTRAIHLSIGTVVERLDHYDPVAKNYSYAFINKDCPLPFLNYSATVQLHGNEDNTTTIEWTGRFEPKGIEESQAKALASTMYANAINGARLELEAS